MAGITLKALTPLNLFGEEMQRNDISTIKLVRASDRGSYLKAIEEDWLRYLGFSEKEINSGSIELVVKADYSKKHDGPFIGIGKKFEK